MAVYSENTYFFHYRECWGGAAILVRSPSANDPKLIQIPVYLFCFVFTLKIKSSWYRFAWKKSYFIALHDNSSSFILAKAILIIKTNKIQNFRKHSTMLLWQVGLISDIINRFAIRCILITFSIHFP